MLRNIFIMILLYLVYTNLSLLIRQYNNKENFVRIIKPRSYNNNYYQAMNYRNRLEYKPGKKKINNRMLKNILKITEDKKKICNKDFIKLGKRINKEIINSKYYDIELMQAQKIYFDANCSDTEEVEDIYDPNQKNHDGLFLIKKIDRIKEKEKEMNKVI